MAVGEKGLWNGAFSGVLQKGRQHMKKNLRRWGPGLKHSFINTGWQKRSQVPDNEEGVAIFLKAIWWQGKQKWHSADEWAEFDLAFWPLTINLTCYFIKNYSYATHIWLWIFTIPFTFFFLNTWSKKINVYVVYSREEEIWDAQKGGRTKKEKRATRPTAIKWFIHAIQNCQGYFLCDWPK